MKPDIDSQYSEPRHTAPSPRAVMNLTSSSTEQAIRVILLDDHLMVLHGLGSHLENVPDISLTGSFSSSGQLMRTLAGAAAPLADVAVIDYALRPDDVDGLNLIRAIRIRFPWLRILVMSAYYTPATVALAMRGGAHGFIGKEQGMSELILAIRRLAAGQTYLSEDMREAMPQQSGEASIPPDALPNLLDHPDLSPREREVLRCCLLGLSVSEIAVKFSRSIKTISNQKQSALKKLGLRSDNELFLQQQRLEGQ
ncbi:Capsular synthesis regulator component B [Chromobacterium violaceum]|uniref:Capsular synthesis regulator component B n=2 Tax=Chromobacterium violaceum TaxID=536 RepID=A0AAX2M8A3_CHRVL|nr:Capsular synthesis regulator component B [Chromobacterium violaceum]SUX32456.1 Capsular synthesis regulator component B [Chromobacterium violaceum]